MYVTVLVTNLSYADGSVGPRPRRARRSVVSCLSIKYPISWRERRSDLRWFLGESVDGEYAGDWGMRNFRRAVGVRAEFGGRTAKGDGGTIGVEADLCGS